MALDVVGTKAVGRISVAVIGALLVAYAYQQRRSPREDPVAAMWAAGARIPSLRADIDLDRLGPGCDGGDHAACVELALNYSRVRQDGLPLPRCLDHALFERACDGGEWRGCRELARWAGRGECGEVDLATARRVLDAACQRLEFSACDVMGELRAGR